MKNGTGIGMKNGMGTETGMGTVMMQEWLSLCNLELALSHLIHVQHFQKEMRGIHEPDPDALIQKALKIKYHPKKLKR